VDLTSVDLTDDERWHFLPAARGGSEPVWCFEGRRSEQARIATWLARHLHGLLMVTGDASAGKTALLGRVFVGGHPQLGPMLTPRRRLIPALRRPPPRIDVMLDLTGQDPAEIVRQLAERTGLRAVPDPPDDPDDPGPGRLRAQVDWLQAAWQDQRRGWTIVVDSLDAAAEPMATARLVLRPLAGGPRVRILVGTRFRLRGDARLDGMDLVDALAADDIVLLERPNKAVRRYVRRRLTGAVDAPREVIRRVSWDIAASRQGFLFARLAASAFIEDPDLLTGDGPARVTSSNCRGLFGLALDRLRRRNPSFVPLLEALALSRGRGLPADGGLWVSMAAALAGQDTVTDADLDALLPAAAPYIAAGREADRTVYRLAHGSFTRHFTGDCLLTGSRPLPPRIAERHALILNHLLAEPQPPLHPHLIAHLSAYAGAAGQAGWQALADRPAVLDQLDPDAVASDALRTAFGRYPLPAAIAAVLTVRDRLRRSTPGDRPGVRQLAMARHAGEVRPAGETQPGPAEPGGDWAVRWARLQHEPPHFTLDAHPSAVTSMCAVPVSDRLCLIASGSRDGTIRLTNPYTGRFWGEPLSAGSEVTALSPFRLPGGRLALAVGTSEGTIRLCDPVAGSPLGEPFTVAAPVRALCEFRWDRRNVLLATGGDDGLIEAWHPVTRQRAWAPMSIGEYTGTVISSLCVVAREPDRALLAAGGDERVVICDPLARTIVWQDDPRYDHSAPAMTVAVPSPERSVLIWCTANGQRSGSGRFGVWDSARGQGGEHWKPGGIDELVTVCASTRTDGQIMLVGGGKGLDLYAAPAMLAFGVLDRDWLNNDRDSNPVFRVELTNYYHRPTVSCAAQLPGRPTLIAVGIDNGTVALWDPQAAESVPPAVGHRRRVHPVQPIARPGESTVVLSAAEDGPVWLWDLDIGNPVAESLDVGYAVRAFGALAVDSAGMLVACGAGGSGVRVYRVPDDATGGFALQEWGHLPTTHRAVSALCGVSVSGAGTFLATAGSEGAVQLWDLLTQDTWGDELDVGVEINAMCRIPVSGRDLLAIGTNGDDEALLLWDPETGATRHLADSPPGVSVVCAVPGPGGSTLAAGSMDGSLALWDPVSGVPLSLTQRTGPAIWAIGTPATSTGRTLIATAGESYRVRLWHPVTLEPVHDIDLRTAVFGMAAVGPALVLAAHTGVIVLHLHDHLFPPAA